MKKKQRKLRLDRETLRALAGESALHGAKGGLTYTCLGRVSCDTCSYTDNYYMSCAGVVSCAVCEAA